MVCTYEKRVKKVENINPQIENTEVFEIKA